ncbi:TRAP transporter fused permease subunit [Salibacterium salarium]|uniref:TRAP transporter fused permease subunit n=1 Tax=Salibacterium salarium TaxID=284579 RepID=A0A3R9R9A3_9BACI|nr:TRAP transporter fused permease subunit [Salibacterium salarium]RSL30142.1 TRAP transporter fused permease subunit [Salibacterium salarium]
MSEKLIEEQQSRYRHLTGIPRYLQSFITIILVICGMLFMLNVHIKLGLGLYSEQWVGIFISLVLFNTFLLVPRSKKTSRTHLPWYDVVLALLSLPSGIWVAVNFPDLVLNLGEVTPVRVMLGLLLILLLLESARRVIGIALVVIAVFFLLYGAYSSNMPGLFAGYEISWGKLINYTFLDPNSMLNLIYLAATYGLAFVFFGQVLLKFGGGDGLTNLSLLMLGRTRGGPAKASVVGSSLVGTVSGAPMSNVFLSGSITIPLMIRNGYKPRFAGAVEAVASSGGQITPPVMGIAAFIIAERLGVPYAEVALAAIIPALLFYIAIFVQVDLEAGKNGLRRLSKEDIPKVKETFRQAWPVMLVIGVLIYGLFVIRLHPTNAAIWASLLAFGVFALVKENRNGYFKRVWKVIEDTGKLIIDVVAALAIAGMVVGVIAVSGLGFTLGYAMTVLGETHVLLLLITAALGSIVLGMGMPSVAAYTLVAVLVAPALVDFGLPVLAAHLFIFYFAIVSNFTPPIAFAAFAASTIAKTGPMETGFTASRLGILAYIMPFIFIFNPSMIMQGSISEIVLSLITAIVGTVILGSALTGYFFNHLNWLFRILLLCSSGALLYPMTGINYTALTNLSGLILAVILLYLSYLINKKMKKNNENSGIYTTG